MPAERGGWLSTHMEGNAVTGVTDQTRYPEPSDPVRLFVSDNLICIEPNATLHQVAHRLAAEGVGALIVTDGDRVVGIISERDVVGAAASGKNLDSTTAAELGTQSCGEVHAGHEHSGGRAAHDGALRAASASRGPQRAHRHGLGPGPPWCLRILTFGSGRVT